MKSWKDIKLKSFIGLNDIYQDDSLDMLDKQTRLLSLLTGKSIKHLEEEITVTDYKRLVEEYKFIDNLPEQRNVTKFQCAGYSWKINKDITKLTTAEFIDLSELTKDRDNIFINAHKCAAIFCTPYKAYPLWIKRYPKLNRAEKAELLKEASVYDIYPLTLFFCNLLAILLEDMEGSSVEELKMTLEKMKSYKADLMNNGAGIKS